MPTTKQAVSWPAPGSDSPLIRNLLASGWITDDEIPAISALRTRSVGSQRDIFNEGDEPGEIFLLKSGWACRYELLHDGRKQIIHVYVPGDLLGPYTRRATSCACAITDAELYRVSRADIGGLWRRSPALIAALEGMLAREHALYARRMATLGRRNAKERMACFLLEIGQRLGRVDLTRDGSFPLPLTQEAIGDTLGMSVVHVNRTLRQLREEGLATVGYGWATIRDFSGLHALAGYPDPAETDQPAGLLHEMTLMDHPLPAE
jgi:CRP-like cAMP-binding protein